MKNYLLYIIAVWATAYTGYYGISRCMSEYELIQLDPKSIRGSWNASENYLLLNKRTGDVYHFIKVEYSKDELERKGVWEKEYRNG